jgi:hypothetical protein
MACGLSPFGDARQDGLAPGSLGRFNAGGHLQEVGFQTGGRFKSRRNGLETRGFLALAVPDEAVAVAAVAVRVAIAVGLCCPCRARKSRLEFSLGRWHIGGQLAQQAGQAVFALQELFEGLAHLAHACASSSRRRRVKA